MKLSIVTTMFRSAPFLREFHGRCAESAARVSDGVEFIFVNDGSPDESLAIALELREAHDNVKVVDLSRNFGHHRAIMEGLAHASGARVLLIDCDLEESPAWLESFWKELDEHPEVDVVYGVQRGRKGRPFERMSGGLFWRAFNLMTGLSLSANAVTVRLMTQRYVNALLGFDEANLFLAGVFHAAGFGQRSLIVDKADKGRSAYTFRRKLELMVEAVTSFSALPLVMIFYLGASVSGASFLYAIYLVVVKLLYGETISAGWTSLMVSIWLVGGMLMMALGIVGIYLSRIYAEVKRRPRTIVRQVHDKRTLAA